MSSRDSIEEKTSKEESLRGRNSRADHDTLHAENAGSGTSPPEDMSEKKIEKKKSRRAHFPGLSDHDDALEPRKTMDDPDVYILDEEDCYEELGFCFPTWKKWTILTSMLLSFGFFF